MSKQTQEQLHQAMAEVVALPVDDPQRQEVMAAIVEADDPILSEQWLAMVATQEQLRLELAMVPVPSALTDRLKKIPVESTKTSAIWWRQWQAVAAMFLVAGLVGWFSLMVVPEQAMAQRWEALSEWSQSHAMKSHHHGDLWHKRQSVEQIEKTLSHALGWSVNMSLFLEDYQTLIGMDVCQFDGKKIVCSQWQGHKKDQQIVIYQICAPTMGLSEAFLLKQKGVMKKNGCFYLSVPIELAETIVD